MMIIFVYGAVWFSLTIWAAWFVSRRVSDRQARIAYYLLIWLLPIFGAAAAVLIIGFGSDKKPTNSPDLLIDAVVDAHKKAGDS